MESIGKIGLILPHINSNIEVELIDAVHVLLAGYGYDTIVITGVLNYHNHMLDQIYCKGQTNIYDLIVSGDFDGFVFEANIFCSERQRRTIIDLLRKSGKPSVVVAYEQPYFYNASLDESVQLYMTTRHLITEHGCKKLYCIGGYKGDKPSEERINGFRRAMDEAALDYNECCIFYGSYWKDIPHQIALDIVNGKLSMPDAIVCGSDIMALEVCRTFSDNGVKVPGDIRVTGCDGNTISQIQSTTITTVAGQERINCLLAVSELLKLLGHSTEPFDITPELIIGESCGCGETRGIFRSGTLSNIREYAGQIFDILESRKTNSQGEIIRRMSECETIYDVIGTFIGCCYMIPTEKRAELCLCDDWCKDMEDQSIYRRNGFSENMILAVDVNCDVFDKMREFNISAVFPSLILPHEPRLTVVTSMHFKGQIFGYVGFTYQKAFHIMLDDFFMNWCDAVCSGLNVVQNRLYNEHIKKHIESLSEFVPALGIYNKRGLIRKLMSILTENGEAVLTLHLMTYIKEERARFDFPPINSIVNAVRLNDSSAILAGIDDEIIAVVSDRCNSLSEQGFAQWIIDVTRKFYNGTIEIKQERIALLSVSITKADLLKFDSIISEMTDLLKGKIISINSGTVSYMEQLSDLRSNIYSSPESDWSIETITRSIGISKTHFHRLYKELFGTSCKNDIITSRIDRAKWLLENTSLSVDQITEKCGYSNNSHFIRQFSTRTGSTPSSYRKHFKD